MTETGVTITVDSYADVAADRRLHDDDPAIVVNELNIHGLKTDHLVTWVTEWALEQKSIRTVDGSDHIVSGRIVQESDEAVCVAIGRSEDWLPRSQLRIYKREPGEPIEMPESAATKVRGGTA